MNDKEMYKLISFNPDKQLAKQRRSEQILDKWFDDQLQGKGNYNPFFRMIKELFNEPPYIPPVDLRSAKERR
jgi:hypothetical protein